ncbi:MAG: tRNA-guanine transglycosylase, partial [Candidatus Krumholzibacteriota bacterium]|nr:tRNA-guanine transglycosylase [Candidatus Krumholzibacteriota bacterium]
MERVPFEFQLEKEDAGGRAGRISTDHGDILTPVFMPVGTQATVKATLPVFLRDPIGAQIILGNAYHLFLRPGVDVVEGKPRRWRVENSYGNSVGDKGFFLMNDSWFDEYMFEIAA